MSTHTAISYHIVFATKDRTPGLTQDRREDRCHLYRINGVADHLHILTSLHPTVCLADFIKEIKIGSARWIKENAVFRRFSYWQEG